MSTRERRPSPTMRRVLARDHLASLSDAELTDDTARIAKRTGASFAMIGMERQSRYERRQVEMRKPKYDSTVARIAGNIMPGLIARGWYDSDDVGRVAVAVRIARAIVAEVQRTEPAPTEDAK